MHTVGAKLMPIARVANVVGKKHFDFGRREWIFGQRARYEPGPCRIDYGEIIAKQRGNGSHHLVRPFRRLLRFGAVADDRLDERMPRASAEGIIADLPVHRVFVPQERMDRQLLEGKYAAVFAQVVEAARQKYVEVQIEPAETIYGEISEQVVTLNREAKRFEQPTILRELALDERVNLRVVEQNIVVCRIEQSCT